ncbi:MAG: OB-fold nucleic acid binding domain-containing protein, partial [Massilioclostridium sp.]|nr:OB-fold nucleic acid binding domain-containing protein [Massilioclostridium sp.]
MADNKKIQEQEQVQDLNELFQIRRDKLDELKQNGNNPFEITKYEVTAYANEIIEHFDEMEGKVVSLAGRMMSKRGMGKASFVDLRDNTGRLQSYVRIDAVGEETYQSFKKWDIGDIIGIEGEVFRTHKGEISIKASKITLLS